MKWHIYLWFMGAVFILAVLFSVLYSLVFRKQPYEISNFVNIGHPFVFVQEQEYFSGIDDVLVSGDYIYVLYGDLHIVKVYNSTRNYVCTIAISNQNSHGERSSIFVKGNTLFMLCSNDIYEFKNNNFIQYHSYTADSTLRKYLHQSKQQYQNRIDNNAWEYYIKGVSVFRKNTADQEEVFLRRPLSLIMCTFLFSWCLWLLFFGLFFFPFLITHNK